MERAYPEDAYLSHSMKVTESYVYEITDASSMFHFLVVHIKKHGAEKMVVIF